MPTAEIYLWLTFEGEDAYAFQWSANSAWGGFVFPGETLAEQVNAAIEFSQTLQVGTAAAQNWIATSVEAPEGATATWAEDIFTELFSMEELRFEDEVLIDATAFMGGDTLLEVLEADNPAWDIGAELLTVLEDLAATLAV